MVAALTQAESVPSPSTPEAFGAFIGSEAANWRALVNEAGIKTE